MKTYTFCSAVRNKAARTFLSLLLLVSFAAGYLPAAAFGQTGSAVSTSAGKYETALAAIEAKTDARRKELGIPGMSLVIVKDDEIIYMKGLGYKDNDKKVPVTPDTQFAIGSATKAFTALSVLMSQDEGKLSLDSSPKTVLPYFKINDPEIDKNITIRDLMNHGSGLNRTDLGWISGKLNREEVIRVAGEAKPTAKLRERFQYQNVMYAAAGEIVAKVQKQPWEKYVPMKIFKPLGMKNSTMTMAAMSKAKDYSLGYDYNFDTKETSQRPFRDLLEISPAGSINSSARDMAQWLRFVMSGGVVEGKRLISEKSFDEWVKVQMKMNPAGTSGYGLGWFIQNWNGLKVVQHGGNIDGFNALVAMIPEKKLGFVMLTNVSASSLGSELMPLVWGNILEDNKSVDPVKVSTETMEQLAGKYLLAAANVEVVVEIENNALVMTIPGQPTYKLEGKGPREFRPVGAPDGFGARFSPAAGPAAELELIQPRGNVTLSRITSGSAGPATSATANELVGRYESETNGSLVEIKDADGKVSLVLPGQPPYALVDKEKDLYTLGGLPAGYSLKVARDDKGKVTKVSVVQPEGEFGFKRLAAASALLSIDELMSKVIDALGGEANWRKINSRVTTFEIDMENQGVKATGRSYAKAPNKIANETKMLALGKEIASGWDYFDGTSGEEEYTFAPVNRYTGKKLEDVRLGADIHALLNWKANYKKAEVLRVTKCGDEACYEVAFEPEKGTKFTEFYSTKTFYQLRRQGVQASSTSSSEIPYTIYYSDYRDVDGVKLPFKTVSTSVTSGRVVTTLKEIKHNVPVDDKIFAPRKLK